MGRETMVKTGIVRDERYMLHDMGPFHPEKPERLEAIYAMLDEEEMAGKFQVIEARPATKKELGFIHESSYIDTIEATRGKENTFLDPDTQTSEDSYDAAILAAGGFCEAISWVHDGRVHNAFALVRPPGHHAEKDRAMGFCLFNNIAIGARYAQKSLNLKRILVIDWDVHHGNGTQHAFEEDSTILYFSTHQSPFYPGTGSFEQTGRGEGEGFTVNIPLSAGMGDREFLGIFEKILRPIALDFLPEIILVSTGFDTYVGDPLGGMRVTPSGFAAMTRSIMEIADYCCHGKMVLTLEGGYDPEGQAECIKKVLLEMAELTQTSPSDYLDDGDQRILERIIKDVRKFHQSYWKNL
jgi:acetoin utilization deacetylase AcuC-like enzyme